MGLAQDARERARAGMAAAQRYFGQYPAPPGPDFEAANRDLEAALRGLPEDDPAWAEASFMLGAIRIADHELRCADPCPAAGELRPIVTLLAAGGIGADTPLQRLYPFAMTADKLYDHTRDPADIDLAITWLRRAAAHRDTPPAERRRAQISLAIQYANQGAFGTAIGQFEEVIAGLARRSFRRDATRDGDRLDAQLGLVETYYQRNGGEVSDDDLDAMAGPARALIAGMTSGYHVRGYALGRCGVLLLQRIMRVVGDPWGRVLNAAVLARDPGAIREAVARVPGLDADLGLATGALGQAFGLEDHAGSRYPVLAAALGSVRAVRYLAYGGDEDLREFGRLCRIVLGHPHATPYYRRQCGEFLLVVLWQHAQASAAGAAAPLRGATGLSPSGHADLDIMIGLLTRYAADSGAALDPALSWALAETARMRAEGELSDAELADAGARQRAAAAAYSALPAVHAALLAQAAATRNEAARTGGRRNGAAAPAAPGPLPSGLDGFDVRALASPGAAVHGRLAVPAGLAAERAGILLAAPARSAAGEAAIRSVLALALAARWLRERDEAFLAQSVVELRRAVDLAEAGLPLHDALVELLAGMLLDRAWVHSDHADVDTAISLLTGLGGRAGAEQARDLNVLLAESGPPGLPPLLATGPAHHGGTQVTMGSARLLRALLRGGPAGPLGAAAPGGADDRSVAEDLAAAAGILRAAAAALPASSPRRPDALSDLGLALLAGGDRENGPRAGLEAMRAAVAACPPGHPRRPSILLRAAAALAVNAHAAYDERLVEEGTGLLGQALESAGLDTHGERPRCLYVRGYLRLTRFGQAGRETDLEDALADLGEARAGLGPSPGDPFTVPLLRLIAWAHRRAGAGRPGLHRSQSRSAGRSILHAQARVVLLQSGSRNAVRAARSAGADALRLAGWCLADGKPDAAVEALELGRALTLHAATIAAGIPALLREADQPGLAGEWEARAGRGIEDVPGDLRRRVLTALRNGPAERRLLAAPELAEIAATLRAVRMDALVYLIPASGEAGGRAVIVHADGTAGELPLPGLVAGPGSPVARFADAIRTAPDSRPPLEELCGWAWTAAIGPLLGQARDWRPGGSRPPRLALAPMGVLGLVPWHAARHDAGGQARYSCSDAVFTTCASARQLIDAAARRRLPVDARSAVLVGRPDQGLPGAEREIDGIWSALYPDGVRLGGPGEPGGPGEVLACLSSGGLRGVRPAVLHLGCHAAAGETPEDSWLDLPGGGLQVSRILEQARTREPGSPGGLVVLSACTSDLTMADYDEALTLTSAFLAAGATGVIGSRWEVSDELTAPMMFMLHRHLAGHPDQSPADALRAAQLWMLDPGREAPPEMPPALAATARWSAARHPLAWAAFACHGQ